MSTGTTTTPRTDLPATGGSAAPRLALGLVGGALTANALVLAPQLFFDSRDYSEVAGSAVHLAHYVLWTACLVALSQLYPRLAALRSPDGRGVPATLLTLAGAGAALAAGPTFTQAFVNPFLADHHPALLDATPDAVLLVPLLACSAAGMLATTAVGLVGGVRRVVPRGAAALLVVGGLAVPVIGPLANVLVGAGLVWTAARARSGVRA